MDLLADVNLPRGGWALRTPDFVWCEVSEKETEMIGKAQESRRRTRWGDGFSLLELMVSIAILLVITGATFSVMSSYQKNYSTTQLQADMYMNLRGVSELMAQEIGQAGLKTTNTYPQAQLTGPVAGGGFGTVPITTVVGMAVTNPPMQVIVDQGQPAQETVNLSAVTTGVPPTISANFANAHASGATVIIVGQGVYQNGVLPFYYPPSPPAPLPPPPPPFDSTKGSTPNTLELFGDINDNGTLQYVYYSCYPTPQQSTPAGTLVRSITPLPTPGGANAPQTLLNNLVANPVNPVTGVTPPCFRLGTVTVAGATFVNTVGVTLSVQSQEKDKVTHQYLVMTKSFLNLTPRNTLGGLELTNYQLNNYLQSPPTGLALPTPAGLPLACPGAPCP
ncbi:MAG: PilW family protein [Terriglobia bacterium]